MQCRGFLVPIVNLVMVAALSGQETEQGPRAPTKPAVADPLTFVTQHEGSFNGRDIRYTATASETHLTNDRDEPTASIWSVAYTLDGAEADRPVTFVFNGGPGSASVWLHMGLFGPRRMQVPSDADADDGAAPYPFVPNPHSPLDATDLVFIDPVGTGYSRAVGGSKDQEFWGLTPDAQSIAQFIRKWITVNRRWNSPRYIAGESFGTTRAAAVADVLAGDGQDVALNGLILISQALDYTGSTPVHDNLIAYVTYLPTMAATAVMTITTHSTPTRIKPWLFLTTVIGLVFFGASSRHRGRVASPLAVFVTARARFIRLSRLLFTRRRTC